MTELRDEQVRPSRRGLFRWITGAGAGVVATSALAATSATPAATAAAPSRDVLDGGTP